LQTIQYVPYQAHYGITEQVRFDIDHDRIRASFCNCPDLFGKGSPGFLNMQVPYRDDARPVRSGIAANEHLLTRGYCCAFSQFHAGTIDLYQSGFQAKIRQFESVLTKCVGLEEIRNRSNVFTVNITHRGRIW